MRESRQGHQKSRRSLEKVLANLLRKSWEGVGKTSPRGCFEGPEKILRICECPDKILGTSAIKSQWRDPAPGSGSEAMYSLKFSVNVFCHLWEQFKIGGRQRVASCAGLRAASLLRCRSVFCFVCSNQHRPSALYFASAKSRTLLTVRLAPLEQPKAEPNSLRPCQVADLSTAKAMAARGHVCHKHGLGLAGTRAHGFTRGFDWVMGKL